MTPSTATASSSSTASASPKPKSGRRLATFTALLATSATLWSTQGFHAGQHAEQQFSLLQHVALDQGLFEVNLNTDTDTSWLIPSDQRLDSRLLMSNPSIEYNLFNARVLQPLRHPIDARANAAFDPARAWLEQRSRIDLESNVEHQTPNTLATSFEAPGLDATSNAKINHVLTLAQTSKDPQTQERGRTALQERAMEIESLLLLIRVTPSEHDAALHDFLTRHASERRVEDHLNGFREQTGTAAGIAAAVPFDTVRAMSPNDLHALVLRQASLAYLSDVGRDHLLHAWFGQHLNDAQDQRALAAMIESSPATLAQVSLGSPLPEAAVPQAWHGSMTGVPAYRQQRPNGLRLDLLKAQDYLHRHVPSLPNVASMVDGTSGLQSPPAPESARPRYISPSAPNEAPIYIPTPVNRTPKL